MTAEVRALLKARDTAFRTDNKAAYSYSPNVTHFQTGKAQVCTKNPRSRPKHGHVANYPEHSQMQSSITHPSVMVMPCRRNDFYARFEEQHAGKEEFHQSSTLSAVVLRRTPFRVNPQHTWPSDHYSEQYILQVS